MIRTNKLESLSQQSCIYNTSFSS